MQDIRCMNWVFTGEMLFAPIPPLWFRHVGPRADYPDIIITITEDSDVLSDDEGGRDDGL